MTWERREPSEHDLPSGATVLLAPGPCVNRLLRTAMVPNPLAGIVLSKDGEADPTRTDVADLTMKRLEYEAALVCATCVDPVVVIEALGEATVFDDIPDTDVEYIVAWAEGGAQAVARFREQRKSPVDREGGEVLEDDAVEPDRASAGAV